MLPKINKPAINFVVPSTKKSVPFRMMTRREEKILLVAKTSEDIADWLMAVRQVVQNCSIAPDFNVDSLASFDLEYLFVKLRAISISPTQKLTYHDHSDDKDYTVEVNLEQVEVSFPGGEQSNIEIANDTMLQMRWPSARTWANKNIINAKDVETAMDELVIDCVEKIWVGKQSYDVATTPKAEVQEFLDTLDVAAWDKIREFVSHNPHLSYWVEWVNTKGETRRFELKTLADFFPYSSTGGA